MNGITKWVDALESGNYKQSGIGYLRVGDKFSALGVLCDLYNPKFWSLAGGTNEQKVYNYYIPNKNCASCEVISDRNLVYPVQTWIGSKGRDPYLPIPFDIIFDYLIHPADISYFIKSYCWNRKIVQLSILQEVLPFPILAQLIKENL